MPTRYPLPTEAISTPSSANTVARQLDQIILQLDQAMNILRATGHLDTLEWLLGAYGHMIRARQLVKELAREGAASL